MRLDVYLVEKKLASTRQKGRYLIDNSLVKVDGKICTKASTDVEGRAVEIIGEGMPYVSRGGFKLEAALKEFKLDVSGKSCIDVGSSTGGFTDCLLKNGALSVIALDSGRDQLHESLRNDPRVRVMEEFNARDLTSDSIGGCVEIAVSDLSFISQTLIHRNIAAVLSEGGLFITLIKPQFEVGKSAIGKGGIVRDEKKRREAVDKVIKSAEYFGFICRGCIRSPIEGGDGNIEYLAAFEIIT